MIICRARCLTAARRHGLFPAHFRRRMDIVMSSPLLICCLLGREEEEEREMKKNSCPRIRSSVPDSHASFHALPAAVASALSHLRCTAPLQMTCEFSVLSFYREHERYPPATQKKVMPSTTTFAKLEIAEKQEGNGPIRPAATRAMRNRHVVLFDLN